MENESEIKIMATENFTTTRNDAIEMSKGNPFIYVWMLQTGPDSFKHQAYAPIRNEQHRVIGIWRNGELVTWEQTR